jgi:hypothetical protein
MAGSSEHDVVGLCPKAAGPHRSSDAELTGDAGQQRQRRAVDGGALEPRLAHQLSDEVGRIGVDDQLADAIHEATTRPAHSDGSAPAGGIGLDARVNASRRLIGRIRYGQLGHVRTPEAKREGDWGCEPRSIVYGGSGSIDGVCTA